MARLRAGFRSHKTLDLSYRKTQLRNLKRLLEENEKQILEAMWKDLRKVRINIGRVKVLIIVAWWEGVGIRWVLALY